MGWATRWPFASNQVAEGSSYQEEDSRRHSSGWWGWWWWPVVGAAALTRRFLPRRAVRHLAGLLDGVEPGSGPARWAFTKESGAEQDGQWNQHHHGDVARMELREVF